MGKFNREKIRGNKQVGTIKKIEKRNDLSVAARNQLKYKISFANQSSGSKEARIWPCCLVTLWLLPLQESQFYLRSWVHPSISLTPIYLKRFP